ncbi:AmmeMemoRadiSam system protein A [Nitrosophilus alvini]|uniref:AmmeMemoRadiSam system protein A n=1 Tax=Nitrosophilus alvini TaxID=2714855 RepID=UPI00190D7728|nr:AmmeMemoRadiSam system protein A [Nitrosophilus alvini]
MDERLKRTLLNIARVAIKEEFMGHKELNEGVIERLTKMFPELLEKRATFVTINEQGSLRGCIGSIIPYRTLLEDVIENAKAAAFHDPRFAPLSRDEFEKINIEISILTVPEILPYSDKEDLRKKIRPGIDGVILKYNGYQATFLPQVWEDLNDFDQFFAHLCMKAGLGPDCLDLHPEILTYQVEKFSEEDFK